MGVVLFICHFLHPVNAFTLYNPGYRQVCHGTTRRSAMPVFDACRARDNVASPDDLYRLAFLLGEPDAGGHNQSLTCRMRMPGGAGTRFKSDIRAGNLNLVIRYEQGINPHATGKVLRWPIHCVLASGGRDLDRGGLLCSPG